VDRGALDAALDSGFPCGGWCPAGRRADDGPIADRYPLAALPTRSYRRRTIRNIRESNGTAILYCGELRGGTRETLRQCLQRHKPFRLIDAEAVAPRQAARLLARFVKAHAVTVLNVAGPRASQWPEAHTYAKQTIRALLAMLRRQGATGRRLAIKTKPRVR
jgi:hypothetical protein